MVTKEKMDLLKSRYVNAKNEQERDAVRKEIAELCDEDAMKVASVATEQIQESIDEINGKVFSGEIVRNNILSLSDKNLPVQFESISYPYFFHA